MDTYELQEVTHGIYALAAWDSSWNSYNNCYVIAGDTGLTLIDSGKTDHSDLLVAALARLEKSPDDVKELLATHGHRDHVGGSVVLSRAHKAIHPLDLPMLPDSVRSSFTQSLPSDGVLGELESALLGQHTTGSIALFHRPTRVLFCGDHICFFGTPFSDEGFVSRAQDTRDRFTQFVADWAQHWPPSEEGRKWIADDLAGRSPQDRERHNFDLFVAGVKALQQFNAVALCTGHGTVLLGEIPAFLRGLTSAATRSGPGVR
ncbi:MAG: MBL fold metallo-hydrolase [bacterium]